MPIVYNEKRYRSAIYFECILGLISSIISLIGLVLVATKVENAKIKPVLFTMSFTFWTFYLVFSIFIIFLGFYSWHREKTLDKREPRKDLKAPIVG
ncbi:MAG: hypothetical protein ACW986_10310 [Promethearchaeota archaeon]|jgi:sterol desaturase/sphingolipid hydroxylase (fatty acid hydroxylase superfamily)